VIAPTLILPHQGGGEFFRKLDTPQLCCGVLHLEFVHKFNPVVMPDLIRHPEALEKTGFRLSPE